MARWLLLACTSLAFASATGSAQQPACDVFCHSQLAERAAAAGDFAGYAAHVREVAVRAPSHPGVVYAQARAFARSGAPDSAIAALARLGRMGDTRDPNADSVFAPLRARPGFVSARNRLLSNRLPILDGRVAFEIADPDLVPEALAFDSTRGRFLVGSLARRVVSAVAPNGAVTPYIAHAPNMLRVVGIHIDAARGRLWFATWAPDSTHRDSTEPPSLTRLFLAELATGRIIKSWTPDGGRPGHLLNDFVVMRDGSLYLTDTEKGSIYRLRSPDDTLELFVQPPLDRYTSANGITVHPDERALYVAFLEGIARLDLTTRELTLVPSPDSVSTASVDGLYWYGNGLIAVQGIPTLARVVRYGVSADGSRITSGAVIERGLPVVQQPTTGVLVGPRFYYIANSQYGRLDDRSGRLAPQTRPPTRTAVRVIDLRP